MIVYRQEKNKVLLDLTSATRKEVLEELKDGFKDVPFFARITPTSCLKRRLVRRAHQLKIITKK